MTVAQAADPKALDTLKNPLLDATGATIENSARFRKDFEESMAHSAPFAKEGTATFLSPAQESRPVAGTETPKTAASYAQSQAKTRGPQPSTVLPGSIPAQSSRRSTVQSTSKALVACSSSAPSAQEVAQTEPPVVETKPVPQPSPTGAQSAANTSQAAVEKLPASRIVSSAYAIAHPSHTPIVAPDGGSLQRQTEAPPINTKTKAETKTNKQEASVLPLAGSSLPFTALPPLQPADGTFLPAGSLVANLAQTREAATGVETSSSILQKETALQAHPGIPEASSRFSVALEAETTPATNPSVVPAASAVAGTPETQELGTAKQTASAASTAANNPPLSLAASQTLEEISPRQGDLSARTEEVQRSAASADATGSTGNRATNILQDSISPTRAHLAPQPLNPSVNQASTQTLAKAAAANSPASASELNTGVTPAASAQPTTKSQLPLTSLGSAKATTSQQLESIPTPHSTQEAWSPNLGKAHSNPPASLGPTENTDVSSATAGPGQTNPQTSSQANLQTNSQSESFVHATPLAAGAAATMTPGAMNATLAVAPHPQALTDVTASYPAAKPSLENIHAEASLAAQHMANFSPAEPATLSTSPRMLEVGMVSGTNGWLKVRAEVDGSGEISASLIAHSANALEALHRDLPALTEYLKGQSVGVSSLVVHRADPAVATPDALTAAQAGTFGQSDSKKEAPQSGSDTPAETRSPESRNPDPRDLPWHYIASSPPANLPAGSSGWLNVIA